VNQQQRYSDVAG